MYNHSISFLLEQAIIEDLHNKKDYSTEACIPSHQQGRAQLIVKQPCILAGVEVAKALLLLIDPQASIRIFKQDGSLCVQGDIAFEVESSVHSLLMCERTLLNCMQRMSGIATLTKQFITAMKDSPTQLLDTRKTTPNFRVFEKEAVRIGGGHNHRMGLYDMMMLKDNHIDFAGGIEKAICQTVTYMNKNQLVIPIEIEARNIQEVREIVKYGKGIVQRIMLDNFTIPHITEALNYIHKSIETEISGGINLDNIYSFACCGADFISTGAIIHQAQSIDLSFKAIIH